MHLNQVKGTVEILQFGSKPIYQPFTQRFGRRITIANATKLKVPHFTYIIGYHSKRTQ